MIIPLRTVQKKIDHATKCYMNKLKSFLDNATHKIHWDFEIETDKPITFR